MNQQDLIIIALSLFVFSLLLLLLLIKSFNQLCISLHVYLSLYRGIVCVYVPPYPEMGMKT